MFILHLLTKRKFNKLQKKMKIPSTSNYKQSWTRYFCFYYYFVCFLISTYCCNSNIRSFFTSITTHVSYWHPSVSLKTVLEMVLTWTMITHLFVTQHIRQRKLHILNHFRCIGEKYFILSCIMWAINFNKHWSTHLASIIKLSVSLFKCIM